MRPVLRPGIHVLRRDERSLQVGLDPDRAVILADDGPVRSCLALLDRAAPRSEYAEPLAEHTLRALERSDLLLDSSRLLPLIPAGEAGRTTPAPPQRRSPSKRSRASVARADVAALAATVGDDVDKRLAARTACRVVVSSFGPAPELSRPGAAALPRSLPEQLGDLLVGSGLQLLGNAGPASRDGRQAGVAAVLGVGEPERELLDGWVGAGTAHVLVRFTEGCATVGPFVVPGQTACLRCIDAHHTDADPGWPLLVKQYSSRVARPRPDGVPEPVDPLLTHLALAWAARDVATFAEGRRPSTWSATIRFDPRLTGVQTHRWLRHPECGCTWQ